MTASESTVSTLALLGDVLAAELAAINQYFVHAEMCAHWGYARLHDQIRAHAIDEMRHAEELIERILFLDGTPEVSHTMPVRIGKTVPEQLEADLALERQAIERMNAAIAAARAASDNGTRMLLDKLLAAEEHHADWIETQIHLIEQVGLERYLAQQIRS